MNFLTVCSTELLKLRRSNVPGLTLLAFSFGPLATALFMWMVLEPGRAAELGLLGVKADLLALDASWSGYLAMITQMVSIVGSLLLAVMAAYVFGREYAEGTARNMLALPIPRPTIVYAKFAVLAAWWLALVTIILLEAAALAALLNLPGLSPSVLGSAVVHLFLIALIVLLLTSVVAWISVLGRGYLLPLGFAMAMLVLGNVLGATGWGKWFPWTIAPLLAGVAGPPAETLSSGSLAVVAATGVMGGIAAVTQITRRDSDQ